MRRRSKFSKGHNRIDWKFLQLSTLKLNLGIFPSKYRSSSLTIYLTGVYVQCKDNGEQRRNYHGNTRKIGI